MNYELLIVNYELLIMNCEFLPSVAAVVNATGDVYPPRSAVVFQDELVEVGILSGVAEDEAGSLLVGSVGKGASRTDDGDVGYPQASHDP